MFGGGPNVIEMLEMNFLHALIYFQFNNPWHFHLMVSDHRTHKQMNQEGLKVHFTNNV